jgi:hypothetical protein
MKTKQLIILKTFLLCSFLTAFESCTRNPDVCLPPRLEVTEKVTVFAGDVLKLEATAGSGAKFKWSGPNNFTSTEQNPSIANITTTGAGEYMVNATIGECSNEKKVIATVLPKPSCAPAQNTINLNGNMSFTSVICFINGVGRYEINGNGPEGGFRIEFYVNPVEKGSFVYDLSSAYSNPYNAYMQIDKEGVLANWQAVEGKLAVKVEGNNLEATFCGATFSNLQSDTKRTGSGKISCS